MTVKFVFVERFAAEPKHGWAGFPIANYPMLML